MTTYVFPGQGSQKKGMGGELFDEFKELTAKADEILGYSIKKLCLEDKDFNLNKTQYTQPALFVVNALTYLKKIKETWKNPDYVAGHSLGEYDALFAAGAFDFETGVKLVKKRGELMSMVTGGAMAAVIGLDEEGLVEVLKENKLYSIDVANLNTTKQIVISGPKEEIDRAIDILDCNDKVKLCQKLSVSGAFHSKYMTEATKEFHEFIKPLKFNSLSIPVISNVYARPFNNENIKETMVKQINTSVKWCESIRYLMGKGETNFEEIGLGKVLTGLISRIQMEAEPLIVEDEIVREEVGNELAQPLTITSKITASSLGDEEFKKHYNLKYAYLIGGMHCGIASSELVVRAAKFGMLAFFGTGGLTLDKIEEGICNIQSRLLSKHTYGVNIVHKLNEEEKDEKIVDLLLKHGVENLEVSAFLNVTPSLVRYHAKGLKRGNNGEIIKTHNIIAKISRLEVSEVFMSPAPDYILEKLLAKNRITHEEYELAKEVPVANDVCVEADSAGYTNSGSAYTLIPAMMRLRDEMMEKYHFENRIRVGAAGGIGTPEAAMTSFMLGADFILTGSINQCTVEARTSDKVKELLQDINVQDTEYAAVVDMFDVGRKVQVLKRGVFFPVRANKFRELLYKYNSLDEIDEKTKNLIQNKYFRRSFEEVYNEIKINYPINEIEKVEKNPRYKMILVFRWYFEYSMDLALSGDKESVVNYQVHCGPALGAFNQWVKGTSLEDWTNRHVDEIGEKIMIGTAELLNKQIKRFF